ncbi:MAG: hypothetical protein K0R75_1417 [Paenibacillaceae bacterium]|nr:hypothetical protein [Paenibacillaceae bacterium]
MLRKKWVKAGMTLLLAALLMPAGWYGGNRAYASSTIASDDCQRSVGTGWGSADSGGAWTMYPDGSYTWTNGTTCNMQSIAANLTHQATLVDVSALDTDTVVSFKVSKTPAGDAFRIQIPSRTSDSGDSNGYRPYVDIKPDGTFRLGALKHVSGTNTSLGTAVTPSPTFTTTSKYFVRTIVEGTSPTTISVKLWKDGTSEPTNPQFTATDSDSALQTAGHVALRTYTYPGLTNYPLTALFDDYVVNSDSTYPSVPTGVYVRLHHDDLFDPGQGGAACKTQVAEALSRSYVHGVSLYVDWADLQPSQSTTHSQQVAYIGTLLDRLDDCAATAGKAADQYGVRIPAFIHLEPTALPGWATLTPLPSGSSPKHRVNNAVSNSAGTGLDVISFATIPGGAFSTDVPYSQAPVYQQVVKDLRSVIADGLDTYDPNGYKVPVVQLIAPAMQSNEMGVPGNTTQFPRGGSPDIYWTTLSGANVADAWTEAKHAAAFNDAASDMSNYPAFTKRTWAFNFTSDASVTLSDQTGVVATLRSEHPAGADRVIVKQENLATNYAGATVWRDNYRSGESGNQFQPSYWIQNQEFHAWELWVPYTSGNGTALAAKASSLMNYPTPGTPPSLSQLDENARFLHFPTDGSAPYGESGTLWVEIWSRDLSDAAVTNFPEFAQFASDLDSHIRSHAAVFSP